MKGNNFMCKKNRFSVKGNNQTEGWHFVRSRQFKLTNYKMKIQHLGPCVFDHLINLLNYLLNKNVFTISKLKLKYYWQYFHNRTKIVSNNLKGTSTTG